MKVWICLGLGRSKVCGRGLYDDYAVPPSSSTITELSIRSYENIAQDKLKIFSSLRQEQIEIWVPGSFFLMGSCWRRS